MINAKLNWKICPLHALASYVASNINAVADPSNNRVFYSINKGNCSKVVCDLLAFIEQKVKDMMNHGELPQDTVYTSNMKSHSFRHGGSTFMQESPFIQRHHIECRGGWKTIGSNNKSGHYLHHTEVVDGFGARALSQWKQSNGGGTLPTVSDLLSDQDRETFHQYCMNIFGVATNVLDLKVIEALAIVLVIYFPEVQQEHNDDQNVLLTRIMLRANQEIPESKLHEWSTTFRNAFRASNAAYLPFNELNPVEKVAISTVQDIMQTMVEGNQASSISAERLVVLTERVVNIEATMQRNHVETMNMLKQIGSIASIPPPLVGVVSSAAGSLSVSPSTVSEPTITTVLMSNTAKACNSDKYLSDYNNSWSNMTMEKAFYNYFDQQLSKCTLPVSKPRRRFLQEFRKVVEFMKLFNTQPINIGKRPSDSLKDTQSLNNWRVALNNLAYHLSNNATEFLPATTTSEDDTTNISATSTHIAKKQKKQSHSVSAMLKIIGNIEKTKCRTLPVPVYVIEDSLLVQ